LQLRQAVELVLELLEHVRHADQSADKRSGVLDTAQNADAEHDNVRDQIGKIVVVGHERSSFGGEIER
jgi:hypothetical protein